jgi:hypothetical protein
MFADENSLGIGPPGLRLCGGSIVLNPQGLGQPINRFAMVGLGRIGEFAVCAVSSSDLAESCELDNLDPAQKIAKDRPDLGPVLGRLFCR